MDEEDKAVERVRRAVAYVVFRVDGPDGTSENTFLGFEVMIADCPRERGGLSILRLEWWKIPWGGVAVNSKVPEQMSWLELGKQESGPKGWARACGRLRGVGEREDLEYAHLLSQQECGLREETEIFKPVRADSAPLR